jgi:hypothetical protein
MSSLEPTARITFVSSLLHFHIYDNIPSIITHFVSLAKTNIHLCIFVSKEFNEIIEPLLEPFPNIKILEIIEYEETWFYNECSQHSPLELPHNRNPEKDTLEYLSHGHIKHELLEKVINANPFQSHYFSWIDLNIFNLFKNPLEPTMFLQWINDPATYLAPSFICFPGCWSKLEKDKIEDIMNTVHWRFCGCFFIGDAESIRQFLALYRKTIQEFFATYKRLVWDFNFWAFMEATATEPEWKPIWYKADHNETILYISGDTYTRTLNIKRKIEYDYPKIDNYLPTSASYLYHQGRHLLNTRYVSYWIYPNGGYHFYNEKRVIENKNLFSFLQNTDENTDLIPQNYDEIDENLDDKYINRDTFSKGLEDIRLYEINGKVKFICNNANYIENGKIRMIVGDYDYTNKKAINAYPISPPNPDNWCEKNWIPIKRDCEYILPDGEMGIVEEELFIYKWYPLEIGRINENRELVIVEKIEIENPLFRKIRGSTIFEETPDGLLGLVHQSEEHSPRHYYHMMVLLDKKTFQIKKYSEFFCFEKLGIEFCIGFKKVEQEYLFWISRHDRDPVLVVVDEGEITWVGKP